MKLPIKHLLTSYSYIALVRNPVFGGILLVLTFANPTSAALSILSFVSVNALGKFIGITDEQMESGLYTYNSLLIGLSMGYLFDFSLLVCIFTILASFLTLLLSFSFHNLFTYYLNVPILNIPFTITATIVFLASIRYSNLLVARHEGYNWLNLDFLPFWITGFLKSVGILMFLPYDIAGIVIIIAILIFSRINFFLIVTGYYSGTLFIALLKGSLPIAFGDFYNFNFILTALALGGFFLIPSATTYLITSAAVLISALILDAVGIFWSTYGIPVFTAPFAVTVTLILYVLKTTRYKGITHDFLDSPERNLEQHINYSSRFKITEPQPLLPFAGEWKVYQGFDGDWTHKGHWRYAIDFVIENHRDKKTYRDEGHNLEDYYCFGKPVLSPVTGTIIESYDKSSDNPIGEVDKQNNWGNYVIIRSAWGYFIEISHLQKSSLKVQKGSQVTVGQIIGKCGNSGYSPEPHIHMQCQYLHTVGSPSIPFVFTNCTANGKTLFGHTYLKKGDFVKPIVPSRAIQNKVQFILDDVYTYTLKKDQKTMETYTFEVRMDPNGCYYFFEPRSKSKLFFQHSDGFFSFYKYEGLRECPLNLLFLALPRIPFTEETVSWIDPINSSLLHGLRPIESFFKSFIHSLYSSDGKYKLQDDGAVCGVINSKSLFKNERIVTKCTFDFYKGFDTITVTRNKKTFSLKREQQNG